MLYQELAIIFNHIEKKCTSNRLILSVQNYKIIATFYNYNYKMGHACPPGFFLSLESTVIIPKRKEKKSKSVRARGGVRP